MGDGKILGANGVDEISSNDFGEITVGSLTPKKFAYFNDKGRVTTPDVSFIEQDGNDMDDYMETVIDTATLSCPYGVAATLISTVTSLTIGSTYGYVMTSLSTLGESGPSLEAVIGITSGHTPQLSWTAINTVSSYKIYRKLSTDATWTNKLITSITSPTQSSYMDVGIPTTTGTVPSANTTAGSSPEYGTAPTSGYATTLDLGSIADGKQVFYWVQVNPDVNALEDDNPRFCVMRISE